MGVRALSAETVLAVWEQGAGRHGLDRALTLLGVVHPEAVWEDLAALTIGERDRGLWQLRERLFGPRVEAVCRCPRCETEIEYGLNVGEVLSPAGAGRREPQVWTDGNWTVVFRLPDSRDLAAAVVAVETGGREAGRELLRKRTVLEMRRGDALVGAEAVPGEVWGGVERRMGELDAPAEVEVTLTCPACDEQWVGAFDIGAFVWEELTALAVRLLREVNVLARAYGWPEAAILRLSPARRQAYLQMATA